MLIDSLITSRFILLDLSLEFERKYQKALLVLYYSSEKTGEKLLTRPCDRSATKLRFQR